MRILVTGYLGYLGSVLVPLLIDAGHDVTGLDSELFKACALYQLPFSIPHISRDIRDVTSDDLAGYDAIIHLAGLSNDPLGDLNPRVTYDINYTAAVRLASLAKYAETPRFLLSSSCAVYGASNKRFVTERSPVRPLSTFAVAKLRAENDIARLADRSFAPTFLRKPPLYGIAPYHRTDTAVNNMVAWAAYNGRVILKTDGESWRPYLHVEDVASAFLAALHAPIRAVHNQILNVVKTEDNFQAREIAARIEQVIEGVRTEQIANPPHDARSYRVDGYQITQALPGWRPLWTLDQGIRQIYEACRASELKLEDFEGARFKRVAYLKHLMTAGRVTDDLRWVDASVRV
ncbi:MAG: NAD(P)-dependent oxidoreductase [Anaerolineae bacterium]|nr:NAD(P)-dependent oxidoreductase [Anaerolineae bacterium]